MTDVAPFRADLAEGPPAGGAVWLRAADGVRIRAVHWPAKRAVQGRLRGTILLLPGRTEVCEKYGRVACDLTAAGWHLLTVDWRGQGLSDRLTDDANMGHIADFSEYQHDLNALFDHADATGLPRPFMMLAHSMGGCIGLRALMGSHGFAAAAFSAPMWGLSMAPALRRAADVLPQLARRVGLGTRYAPTTAPATYFLQAPFEGNLLTTDRDHWDYMVRQAREEPRFRLGGPSLSWLAAALDEMRALTVPANSVPAHASVGEMEKVVDPAAVRRIMAGWPNGTLTEVPMAEHELLMERDEMRTPFLGRVLDLFDQVGAPSRQGRNTA